MARFHPNLKGEHTGEVRHLSFPPTSREDSQLDGYLEYLHAAKTLYIYKHPCLLRESNSGSTTQQSASLTILPDGWRGMSSIC
ncbi:hypothetical protein TNCV_4500581 [Trichonephila clavipes]|nr:hypothetical protein TNCV_4500581 [Trichonephila clavipes]